MEILGGELRDLNGAENVTLRYIPGQRLLNETEAGGDWSTYLTDIIDTPQSEQEQSGANYQGNTMGAGIYNLFIRGTVGFSEFVHNLLGVDGVNPTSAGEATISWMIDLAEWFMVVGHALILFQVIGKIIPGVG